MIESKPEHFLDDLRLNNPWPELKRYRVVLSFFWLIFFYAKMRASLGPWCNGNVTAVWPGGLELK